jgi:hypothetical protein
MTCRPSDGRWCSSGRTNIHSNELPWFESSEVVEVAETSRGEVCLDDLAASSGGRRGRPLVIGSFSAASNVTGILTDVHAIARVLVPEGRWRSSTSRACAPYVPIDMHPPGDGGAARRGFHVDAQVRRGTAVDRVCGCARAVLRKGVPDRPGGGHVEYVFVFRTPQHSTTCASRGARGGRHAGDHGDVRAGAAFLVRELMDPPALAAGRGRVGARAPSRGCRNIPGSVRALDCRGCRSCRSSSTGCTTTSCLRSSTTSSAFQNRAGCACAGPYGHRLLSRPRHLAGHPRLGAARVLGIKPGWTG